MKNTKLKRFLWNLAADPSDPGTAMFSGRYAGRALSARQHRENSRISWLRLRTGMAGFHVREHGISPQEHRPTPPATFST